MSASTPVSAVSVGGIGQRQSRLHDSHVRDQRVVHQRRLATTHGQHRGGRYLGPGAGGGRDRHQPHRVVDLGVVRHALARVEERQGQLVERELGALVEQARGVGGVDHRSASRRDQEVGPQLVEHLHAGADLSLARLGLDVGRTRGHRCRRGAGGSPPRRRGSPTRGRSPASPACAQLAQAVDRTHVEIGVRGHPEPLGRHLPARDRLDVEQVAVVDVVGRDRAAQVPQPSENVGVIELYTPPSAPTAVGALTRMRPVRIVSAKRSITSSSVA